MMSTIDQRAKLILEDGSVYQGNSFGAPVSTAGEVVFNTGMVGYPETLTDPSYKGQILALTYPLIGNYGVPAAQVENNLSKALESNCIQVQGMIISDYSREFYHWNSIKSLSQWLKEHNIPALSGIDTRALTKKLRLKGSMLGKIEFDGNELNFYDPNKDNLGEKVSITEPVLYGKANRRIAVIDCGCKANIIRSLLKREVEVLRAPLDYNLSTESCSGVVISNGPGNPKMYPQTIEIIRKLITNNIPLFGICLGHQLLSLAVGANTYKLKYGHRSQNQPVLEVDTNRCMVTSQNHGYAVDSASLPKNWKPWFINLNDGTNEGIRHVSGRFGSVQFHPEASPGPVEAGYLFDKFLEMVYK